MARWNEVNFSQLDSDIRVDSEYYKPEHLQLDRLLAIQNSPKWEDIEGDFIVGPFGSAFHVENYVESSSYRYVRGRDVKPFFLLDDENCYIPEEDFERLRKYSLEEGDLLVSVVGTLGNVAIVTRDVGQAIFSCKSTAFRSRSLDPNYLCAYLNSRIGQSYLQRTVRGHVQTGLNLVDLKKIPIFPPSEKLEWEVAATVRNAFEKKQLSFRLYSEAQSLLLEELGLKGLDVFSSLYYARDFSEAQQAARLDAEFFQPKYYRLLDTINRCPYRHVELGSLIHPIKNGFDCREFSDEGTPYIRVGDIKTGRIDLKSTKKLSIGWDAINKDVRLKLGDVLLTRKGSFGKAAHVRKGQVHSVISSEIMLVRLKDKTIKPEFLTVYLNSPLGFHQIERYVHGVAFYSISQNDLARLRIILAPDPVQNRICEIIGQSDAALDESIHLLDEAKGMVENAVSREED